MKIQNIHTTDLRPIFVKNQELGRESIEDYLRTIGNYNVEYTLNSLVKSGLLERTGRGRYSLGLKRQIYSPPLENAIKGIYGLIQEEKPLLECCVWRTSIINEFTLHQAGRFAQIVEIERDGLEAVFDLLRDHYPNVYLNPSDELLDRYIAYQNDAIIIIPLTSEAPMQKIEGIRTTTIEKLLVDLIVDIKLYESFQGAELAYIIKEAFRKYPINKDKMLRYARRRRKGNKVEIMIELSLQTEDF
ncbi:hypothetical protein LV89_04469 [Arcicella aurantiaca]|uniref:Uncharacterized protein n=1 Tax=Arcicella aurantiaca TaxID=591202 RepID=A0A316DKF9_9BACT|nr:DUF6577 family protein [Arcicella aurantiaca]PWK17183.1 hypothetical protein LV89_04469 [Arcicella aurantiaca]